MGIIEKAKVIRQDLANHFIYGSAVYLVSYILIILFLLVISNIAFPIPAEYVNYISAGTALIFVAIAAYGKELYSKNTGRGTYDMADFRFTVYGGLVPFITNVVTFITIC